MKRKPLFFESRFLIRLLSWIQCSFRNTVPGMVELSKPFLNQLILVERTRGREALITYVKKVRSSFLNYLSGNIEKIEGIGLTKDGIPRCLGPLIHKIRGHTTPIWLQWVTTILYSIRSLKCGKSLDTTSIEQPVTEQVPSSIAKYSKDFWKSLGLWPSQSVPRRCRWTKFHMSTKSGPNGHALSTSLVDLINLPGELLHSLYSFGGETFQLKVQTLIRGIQQDILKGPTFFPKEGNEIRKLTYFPDREDKVRVVAIFDYWSQTVLKPFHSYLYRVLKKIPQDCTFDQGAFKDKMKDRDIYYSVDISAFTDRFPISVIASVLKAKFPERYINSWVHIMVGYPFTCEGKKIFYEVGNPMGAYSSWASAALAHHYVVYYCCRELNKDWKTLPYCLLGDDIVIADKEVGELYIQTIRSLGMEVSSAKTHTSPHFFEFAKRLFFKGKEITHFPISAIKESSRKYYHLTSVLMNAMEKGWIPKGRFGIPLAVSQLYGHLYNLPSRLRKQMFIRSYISERIILVIQGRLTAFNAINGIIRRLDLPSVPASEEHLEIQMRNTILECFTKSDPSMNSSNKGKPLGELSTHLVMYFTSFMEDPEKSQLGLDLIYALPTLSVYGQIEEKYLNLRKSVSEMYISEWPMYLKSAQLPESDLIFSQRSDKMITASTSVLGRLLVKHINNLVNLPTWAFLIPYGSETDI